MIQPSPGQLQDILSLSYMGALVALGVAYGTLKLTQIQNQKRIEKMEKSLYGTDEARGVVEQVRCLNETVYPEE